MDFFKNSLSAGLKDRGILIVFAFSALSFVLLGLRVHYTGDPMYLFLIWNTFLALLPLGLSLILERVKSPWAFWPLVVLWLLFFPNAPYLVTDFIHLGKRPLAPLWFDTLLLLSFALLGLLAGLVSLRKVEAGLRRRIPQALILPSLILVLILSGGAIFLGRFLRWNSWDMFTNLSRVLRDLFTLLLSRDGSWRFWGFTFLFALFQGILYWTLVVPLLPLTSSRKASAIVDRSSEDYCAKQRIKKHLS